MKKILVTGFAGFIGSHLVEKLISADIEVVGIDNFDDYYSPAVKKNNISGFVESRLFYYERGDIRDKELLKEIIQKHNPECIIHLAAKAGVRQSIVNPEEYVSVNIAGTLNILEAMKSFGITKMVLASSSSVYGNNKKVPFSESDSVDNPISPYAATKKASELLCHAYHHLYGMSINCMRFFTVYGPRQRPDLAIHKFTDCIMQNKPIQVYGDGGTQRDYTYVEDIIDGVYKSLYKFNGYNIYNLGESETISINKTISTLEEVLNKKAIIEYTERQDGDVDVTYSDISKAKRELKYCPKWPFESGIKKFIEWKLRQK